NAEDKPQHTGNLTHQSGMKATEYSDRCHRNHLNMIYSFSHSKFYLIRFKESSRQTTQDSFPTAKLIKILEFTEFLHLSIWQRSQILLIL
ncbi:MAG: hypothetical protein K2K98_14650, partial [Muribaculaceae bacterium]|nr:hypothetical protein [Muribaculaceae bacterium]